MTTINLQYGKLNQAVSFRGCPNLVELLQKISNGVPMQRLKEVELQVPQIIISWTEGGYKRESAWLSGSSFFKDAVDAVGDLTVDLIHGLVNASPNTLCLHCAAVEFVNGLYIFPMTYRAGKSLISTYLSTIGARLYTDDALIITPEDNSGMATGLYPRLRLPLPEQLDDYFKNIVKSRRLLYNRRYCYIGLTSEEMVPYGTSAPIKGVILLYREKIDQPRLEPLGKKEAIKEVILRNFARNNSTIDIVDRISSIVNNADCYKLSYQHVPEAARLLMQNIGNE